MKLSMEDHDELIDEAHIVHCREDFDYEEELLIDDDDLEYNSLILILVANVLDVSWTCPGLVHLSLFLAPTAIPQGH